jgi:two-component system, LuxR family, response regulator FixJ
MTGTELARVIIVDDDEDIRIALETLMQSLGRETLGFEDGVSFLQYLDDHSIDDACILTDVRMPRLSGIQLLERLKERGSPAQCIVMTSFADVPLAVRCMRLGAIDFIEKPFQEQRVIDAVEYGERRAVLRQQLGGLSDEVLQRFQSLTPRQREVMVHIARGSANKVVAEDLGISAKTVEIHRARVMRTMEATSLAELVRHVVGLERAGTVRPKACKRGTADADAGDAADG